MECSFVIGSVSFRIKSQIDLKIEESLKPFLEENIPEPEVKVQISTNFSKAPKLPERFEGEDLLLEYDSWNDQILCVGKGGWKGKLSVTVSDFDFRNITCYLNTEVFSTAAYSIGNILRLLPMRMIFQQKQVLFLHAAQIAVNDVGILFSAPSGTGKTTQAKLWKKYRGTKIVCNDRTLICRGQTYGYPIDGSEPVISGESYRLGAIVLLAQSETNSIQKMKAGKALTKLMSQLVFDTWSSRERELALTHLMELIEQFPVYLLSCTPDEEAVSCLEQQLKKDGVLK